MASESIPEKEAAVSDNSDLVEIAKRNGDFRRNYGPWLGAILYTVSVRTAGRQSFPWKSLLSIAVIGLGVLSRIAWPH
jgi:hypothetical protein